MIPAAAGLLAIWRTELLAPGAPLLGILWLYFHPLYEQTTRQVLAGHFPLWNPLQGLGVPLLADPQAGVLAPAHALFRIFPFWAALRANTMLDAALLGGGAYLLARRLGARRLSAAIAALLAGGGGFAYHHAALIAHFDSLALMPWVLLFWVSGRGVLAGLAVVLQLAGGHPFFVYMTLLACAALRPARPWTALGRAGLAAGGAGALLLLGAAALFSTSGRSGALGAESAFVYSLSPDELWTMLARPWWNRDPRAFSGDPTITSFYLGLPGLALALFGAWKARRPEVSALAAASLALMLGPHTPLYPLLLKVLPGLSLFRYPAQWGGLAALAAALLAAFGADALSPRLRVLAWLAVAADLAVFAAVPVTGRAPLEALTARPASLERANLAAGERVVHSPAFFAQQAEAGQSPEEWRARLEALAPSRATLYRLGELSSYNIATSKRVRARVERAFAARDVAALRELGAAVVIEPDGKGGASMTRISSAPRAPVRAWAPGWRVFADGKEHPVVENDGLRLPGEGSSGTIDWVYDPAYARWGLPLLTLTLLALLSSVLRACAGSVIVRSDAVALPRVQYPD